MIAPDDPRHGTPTGYKKGCRNECCRAAHRRHMKLWRVGRTPNLIDPTGTRRRIQALNALGWTTREISDRAGGYVKNWASEVMKQPRVSQVTAARVARVYEQLCMTIPPPSNYRARTQRRARAQGWVPPLAWTNIDDPDEQPTDWEYQPPTREEELEELVEVGAGITAAVAALGITRKGIEKWCDRHDRRDLYATLAGREDVPQVQNNQWTKGSAA